MVKYSLSLAVLVGLLLSLAGVAQAESGYSPVTTLTSSISSASSSGATSTYFTNTAGTGGPWTTTGNWNAGTPAANMNAYIGYTTGGVTANLSSSVTSANLGNVLVGTGSGNPYIGVGTLNMTGAAALTVTANGNGVVYAGYSSTGTINISGGTLTSLGGMIGGYSASYTTATGTVNVSGSTSKWAQTGTGYSGSTAIYTDVGYYGPGYLNITSGGTMTSTSAYVGGVGTLGTGTVTVDGSGGSSKWTASAPSKSATKPAER